MYIHNRTVCMGDTDAAGIIYFASLLRFAHEAFEAYLTLRGADWKDILASPVLLPIVHAEADYRAPLTVGDALRIEVELDQIGKGSFATRYRFLLDDGTEAATARLVHASVLRNGMKKTSLPPETRTLLEALRNPPEPLPPPDPGHRGP